MTLATIVVALIGAIVVFAVALINNQSGRQGIDPMWRGIAAIIAMGAALYGLIYVILDALIGSYHITGLMVSLVVLAIGVVLWKPPKAPRAD
jgi:hypothetical protein